MVNAVTTYEEVSKLAHSIWKRYEKIDAQEERLWAAYDIATEEKDRLYDILIHAMIKGEDYSQPEAAYETARQNWKRIEAAWDKIAKEKKSIYALHKKVTALKAAL